MSKDLLDSVFEELKDNFDLETPKSGHDERFQNKLKELKHSESGFRSIYKKWFRPLGIAASIALLIGIGWISFNNPKASELSENSNEVEKAQFYFASVIEQQIEQIKSETTPETQLLVEDVMIQMKKLEDNYQKLEMELENTGNTELILNAMITNFQTRINLLQDVMENIKEVKKLKSTNNENNIT